MNLALHHRNEIQRLSGALRAELDQLIAAISTAWSLQHREDGAHSHVTVEELLPVLTGFADGTVEKPSVAFASHTALPGGAAFSRPSWPGWYMRQNATGTLREWLFANDALSLLSLSGNGLIPINSSLVLGSEGLVTGAKPWLLAAIRRVQYQTQTILSSGGHSITTTGTVTNLDLEVGTYSYHEFNGAGALTIRGIDNPGLFPSGERAVHHILHNNTANNVTLNHNDGAATAANRLQSPTGANVVLGQYDTAVIFYNGTDWRYQSIAI